MKGGKDPWHTVFEAAEDRKGYHSSLNFLCVLFTVVYARICRKNKLNAKKLRKMRRDLSLKQIYVYSLLILQAKCGKLRVWPRAILR